MAGSVTTYLPRRPGFDPADLTASLRREGYLIGPTESVTRTVLDTFDGRIAAAGLRLELTTAATPGRPPRAGDLVLWGGEGATARVTITGVPRAAADVPAGPFRFRLARLLDVRALIPLIVVSAQRTLVTKQNRSRKRTVAAALYAAPRVGDERVHDHVVDVIELAGYPKPATELRELVEASGLRERPSGDLVDLAAAATGTDLAGCTVAPDVELDADLPAIDGFRRVLANLRDAMVVNWDGTVADIDPEFLHDLRVAVRRTRSVLANAKGVLPEAVRERSRADFGWLGQITGRARDLDVYQIEWPDYTAPLGGDAATALDPVRTHLEERRQIAHEVLSVELAGDRASAIVEAWSTWLAGPLDGDLPDDARQPIGALVERRIRRAHQTMVKRGRTITPATDAGVLHELRKDAKKLRYLLECFGGLYESALRKAFVQRLKALQDNLGEHQDAEVHVHHLRRLSDTLAPVSTIDTMLATGQLIERLEQRRIACRHAFAERFAAFDDVRTEDALGALLASAGRGVSA